MNQVAAEAGAREVRLRALRKVVHVCAPSAADTSEAQHQASGLALALRALGVDAHVAMPEADDPASMLPEWVHRFPRSPGPRWMTSSSRLHHWLRGAAGTGEIGMLHALGAWNMPVVYPGWVSKWNWTPLVVSPLGMLSEQSFDRHSRIGGTFWHFVQRPAFRAATCFRAIDRQESAQIRSLGFRQPIALIPQGLDIGDTSPAVPGPRRFVCAGDLGPDSVADVIVRAWGVAFRDQPAWELHLYDRSSARATHFARLKRITAETGAPTVFHPDSPQPEYRASDIAIPAPSASRGCNETARALASGVPAICVGSEEWRQLRERGSGWWSEISVRGVAESMVDAMAVGSDTSLQMGGLGQRWMLVERAWSVVSDRTARLYEWIISGMPESARPEWVIAAEPESANGSIPEEDDR